MIDDERKAREARLDALRNLEPCQGIMRHPRYDLPIPIIATPITLPSASREELRALMKPFWDAHPPVPYNPPSPALKSALSEQHKHFLMAVATKPHLSTMEYYKQLGWPPATASRIKRQLADKGLIKIHAITTGRRGASLEAIELLVPAYEKIGLAKPPQTGKGSFIHVWWMARIKLCLERNGNGA